MNGHSDTPANEARSTDGADVLRAAAELEERLREASLRLARKETARRTLVEIRDSLSAEERLLAERITVAQAEHQREIRSQVLAGVAQTPSAADLEALRHEIGDLEATYAEGEERERVLLERIGVAEEGLAGARERLAGLTREMKKSEARLARLVERYSLEKPVP